MSSAFETLPQVQETIRRAYLAGGLAPTPAPLVEFPIEPLSGGAFAVPVDFPRRSGGAYFEEELKRLAAAAVAEVCSDRLFNPAGPQPAKENSESLHQKSTPGLYAYAKAFGEATLIEFLYARLYDSSSLRFAKHSANGLGCYIQPVCGMARTNSGNFSVSRD